MLPQELLFDELKRWLRVTLHHSMHGFMHYSREVGLSPSQVGAMFQIHWANKHGVSYIGEELGISNAAASQMAEKLVQLGYVAREEDPSDRRGRLLSLTAEGEDLVSEVIEARQQWLHALADAIPPDEATEAARILSILTQNARQIHRSDRRGTRCERHPHGGPRRGGHHHGRARFGGRGQE